MDRETGRICNEPDRVRNREGHRFQEGEPIMTQFFILRIIEKEGEKEAEDWTDAGMSINPSLLQMRGWNLSEKGRITRWKVEPVNSDEVKL